MIGAGSTPYAAARMHARLGRRPDATDWRALGQSRELAPMLELLAPTTLAAVARPLAIAPDLHALDRAACQAWRLTVMEAACWVQPALARAVRWCAVLPLLPTLAHLLRGESAAPWMRAYPELEELCSAGTGVCPLPRAGSELAPLVRAWSSADSLGEEWLAEWRRRLPGALRRESGFVAIAATVARHVQRIGAAGSHQSAPLRVRLDHALLHHFRRHAQEPSAVFAWLGLAALDIRRLRGEFAWRIALPAASPVP